MTNSQPKRKVPCEVYSRIVGYLRPVRNWNVGKKQEYAEREEYVVQARIMEAQSSKGECQVTDPQLSTSNFQNG
jgi:hypothetical protein